LQDKTEDVCMRELAQATAAAASSSRQQSGQHPVAIALPIALGKQTHVAAYFSSLTRLSHHHFVSVG